MLTSGADHGYGYFLLSASIVVYIQYIDMSTQNAGNLS